VSDEQKPDEREPAAAAESPPQSIDPQRLLRIASVTREVLEEARRIRPEPAAVAHLREVHAQITNELKESLPTELYDELDELTPDIRDGTLEELALAHAEILGWLEGLFQGTQLAIQMQAARAFQDQQRRLVPGGRPQQQEPDTGRDSRYL
jgi:acetoin utilization deacetylase AcuC-like enzyme